MRGELTGIVLGAGASYCYEDGASNIPMQSDIIGRLFFGADTGSGEGFPSFVGPAGLQHSFPLAQLLRRKFAMSEDPSRPHSKMDFWTELQKKNFNLETLYAELESDPEFSETGLLAEFQAIIRTAVTGPVGERTRRTVCRHHRLLCEALEPGDFIIDFNWDSVMADALLYYSHFWFPHTGFGVPALGSLLAPCQKVHRVRSYVTLLHVHGSVVLFEPEDSRLPKGLLYVGPRQWSAGTGLFAVTNIDPTQDDQETIGRKFQQLRPEDEEKISRGHVFVDKNWFAPLYVPPSQHKKQYEHWYVAEMRKAIHSRLPSVERLIVMGYSFPPADTEHLKRLFVPEVLPSDLAITVVNPWNQDAEFRSRVSQVFPTVEEIDYSVSDFRLFCSSLRPAAVGADVEQTTMSQAAANPGPQPDGTAGAAPRG